MVDPRFVCWLLPLYTSGQVLALITSYFTFGDVLMIFAGDFTELKFTKVRTVKSQLFGGQKYLKNSD